MSVPVPLKAGPIQLPEETQKTGQTYRPYLQRGNDEFDECDREFAQEEGEWALISYKRIRVCGFAPEQKTEKVVFAGGASLPGQSLRFYFKISDIPNIRCGMPLWLKGCRYTVDSDPMYCDGWHYVTLKDCQECSE